MKKGFTLLFAVLISSLLLSVGIAILDLSIKEFALSAAARESQYAFYAADDGLECGLYWDHNNPLAVSSTTSSFATSTQSVPNTTMSCNGSNVTIGAGSPLIGQNGNYLFATTTISLTYQKLSGTILVADPNGPCATVTIFKSTSTAGSSTGVTATTISSRGYDTCNTNNPYRTERGIESSY